MSWTECIALLRDLRADLCIFAKTTFDAGAFALDLAARILFRRYITIEHMMAESMPPRTSRRHCFGLLPGLGFWWYRLFLKRHLRSVIPKRVVCVSDAIKNRLIRDYRFPHTKLLRIHTGVDPVLFQRSPESRRSMRIAWGIPQDALVFGSVGRMDHCKGYDILLDLFPQVATNLPRRDIRLVLVGEGPRKGALEISARNSALKDNRVLFAGFMDKPWEAYSAFDIFAMPSRTEGLPLALLEAMASSCCPIAMGVGGIPEVISDPSLGWLVQPGDRLGLLHAMKMAAQCNNDELHLMGARARAHIMAEFDARPQYQILAELIESECLARPGRTLAPASLFV
jgi:glycosyltransferase involved in cell wall biosynthesis